MIELSRKHDIIGVAILEAIPDFVASIEPDGEIIFLNRGAREMLGLSFEENVTDLNLFDLYPDRAKKLVQNEAIPTMIKSGFWEGETVLYGAGGIEIPVSQIIVPQKNKEGDLLYISTIARDIRPLKEVEEQLLQIIKLESLGFIAGDLAHDFNNLLMGISLNVGLALLKSRDDEVRDLLKRIEVIISQAQGLSQQLRTFAHAEDPVRSAISLQPLIESVVKKTVRSSSITVELNLQDDLDTVFADSDQIIHAIRNLVINAHEAMPESGKISVTAENHVVEASESIRGVSAGKYIKIVIADDGIGIHPDIIRNIFDPFFTTRPGNSGLGLTACLDIFKRHGGGITVDSTVGKGSVFTLYIPAAKNKDNFEITEIGHDNKSMNILVMDDEPTVRLGLESLLSTMGNKVTTASCGEDALHLYESAMEAGQPYDLVILDLMVPGKMGGSDTMRRLKQIDPNVAGILSSGYANDPTMVNYGDHGFKAVLPKPYTHEHLELVISDLAAMA